MLKKILLFLFLVPLVNCETKKTNEKVDILGSKRPNIEQSKEFIMRTINANSDFKYTYNLIEARITDSEINFEGDAVSYNYNQIETRGVNEYNSNSLEINVSYKFNLNDISKVYRNSDDLVYIELYNVIEKVTTPINGTTFIGKYDPYIQKTLDLEIRCPTSKQTQLVNAFENIRVLMNSQNGNEFFRDSIH